jgi:hypothetical protein
MRIPVEARREVRLVEVRYVTDVSPRDHRPGVASFVGEARLLEVGQLPTPPPGLGAGIWFRTGVV